ncbi:interferon-inducible GTPase 5-like, partial [Chelydra serpentina]
PQRTQASWLSTPTPSSPTNHQTPLPCQRVGENPGVLTPALLLLAVVAMAAPAGLDDAFLRALRAGYEAQDPGTAAARLQALVDSANALKADVAVVGRRGAGVTTLIRALVGERPGLDDPQAFFRPAPEPPGQPAGYPHPSYPHLALWDLPGFQEPEKPGDYTKRLGDLGRYGCLVLVVAEGSPADPHLQLLKAFQQKRKP